MAKCIVLLSGGLDSMMAVRILRNLGVDVLPVCFESHFFSSAAALRAGDVLGERVRVVSIGDEHLDIVKNPRFGRGKGMNPCIDCHLFMLKNAGELMKAENYDFLATGEVLDERPFSQNAKVMKMMEQDAGLEGLVLRPLSARVLDETMPEKNGLVDRARLYSLRGKSRKEHLALAAKLEIKKFPSPAGGCILTDKDYARKLRDLFEKVPGCSGSDCVLLRKGRVFWENSCLFIAGRNKQENEELEKLASSGDTIIKPGNFNGPTVLARKFCGSTGDVEPAASQIILKYSKNVPTDYILTRINTN
jgi:predicted subunit of tRNA(5-methylaminomethyl-2-thiouridylate) methyltransferase